MTLQDTAAAMGELPPHGVGTWNLGALLPGLMAAVVATLIFLLALRLLVQARRRTSHALLRASGDWARTFELGGVTLLDARQIRTFLRRAIEVVAWATGLFLAYLWLTFVLTRFAYTQPWGDALGTYLLGTVTSVLLGVATSVPGLFTIVVILLATRFVTGLVSTIFEALEAGTLAVPWVHPETAQPTRRIVIALLWLFAIVVSYPHLPGSNSEAFKGVSVFLGLVISLGSMGVMGQAMSGLVLMYSRALRPGDYVRIGQVEGTVTELGMLSTKVRTTKLEEVTIPNAVVVTAETKNFSRLSTTGQGVMLYTSVTIGYDTPWRQVHGMLLEAARRTEGIRAEPEPFVLQRGLADFYVEYELSVHVDSPEQRMRTLSVLHAHIQDVFNEYGVQIMSPHFRAQPDQAVVVPKQKWYEPPAIGE